MKAICYNQSGIQVIRDYPRPEPLPDEIRIRVSMAGICRTDLEITKGYMGFEGILGHEFVGKIEEAAGTLPAGARVVGEINAGCGLCGYCRQNLQRHCPNRSVLGIFKRNGCMAEWLTLPVENLFPLPDALPDRHAVFVEPLAAALEIFEQILIQPAQKVCILGDGKLGLLAALTFSHRHEGETLLIGHHSDKLAVVEDRMAVLLEKNMPSAYAKSWDVVVEATGTSSGLRRAMSLIRPRGTIVLKSTMAQSESLDLTPLVIDEINLIGSRCGRFAPAINLLSRGVLPIDRLIETIFPIDKALEAWDCANRPGAKKVLLQIGDE